MEEKMYVFLYLMTEEFHAKLVRKCKIKKKSILVRRAKTIVLDSVSKKEFKSRVKTTCAYRRVCLILLILDLKESRSGSRPKSARIQFQGTTVSGKNE